MIRRACAIQLPLYHKYGLVLMTLTCALLLAGCASPPQEPPESASISRAGERASAHPQAQPVDSATPPEPNEPPAADGEAAVTFEKNLHDFGEIGLLTKNVYEFRFKNTGTGVLKVEKKIDSTCGCTVAALSQTEYAPGQEGVIRVTYSAGDIAGPTIKHLVVYTNDPHSGGTVPLTIQAAVVERVACEPKLLALKLRGPGTGCPPITVRSLDHRSFAVTRIFSTGKTIGADFDPSLQATEFTFRPTVDTERLQKYPTGSLVLALTHPECPEVRIPYEAVPEFRFTPSSIILFDAEPNRPILREVWLANSYGEVFEIASCVSTSNMVRVLEQEKLLSNDGKNVRYHLRLSIQPPALPDERRFFEGTLVVRLTDGKTLELPCRVIYRSPSIPLPNSRIRKR